MEKKLIIDLHLLIDFQEIFDNEQQEALFNESSEDSQKVFIADYIRNNVIDDISSIEYKIV